MPTTPAAPPPSSEYHLRGELVTDEPAFYTQLGRILDAPDGYYGTNLDALDWVTDPDSPRYRPSERVVSRLLAAARPGDIILMHLGSDRSDPVADHLPRLLDGFSSEGFRFSTASELLGGGTK